MQTSSKPGLFKAHCRVIMARLGLKKALAEYRAFKFSPTDTKTAAASVVTTPAAAGQLGETHCLFPQPEFRNHGSFFTGVPYFYTLSSSVRPDYSYTDFDYDLCATHLVPTGGHRLVSLGSLVCACAEVCRG